MREYDLQNKWQKLLIPDIVALLTQIHEYKGAQTHSVEISKNALAQLTEAARVQSIEASNRIEGIVTSDERMKKIVLDKTLPRTKSEQEIAGYRDALSAIHESYEYIPLRPTMILQLHRELYRFCGLSVGGVYRGSENMAAQPDDEEEQTVQFQPVPVWETAEAITLACQAYDKAVQAGADPLLLIPMFVLDFLCIHPFNDGSGRMSRLLTLLLLYRSGYVVGKYISIEKLMEQSREEYFRALRQSAIGWYEEQNDYAPFVRYLLGIIAAAYREFPARVKLLSAGGLSKPERIRALIRDTAGKITKAEIIAKFPDISQVTVQRTLIDLQNSNEIIKLGGGRYTAYIWNKEND